MSDDNKSESAGTGSEDSGKTLDAETLNTLLSRWDEKSASDKGKEPDIDPAVARELGEMRYELEMPKIIPLVKGELPVSDIFVEKYINGAASKDPRLLKLWDGRKSDPEPFDKAMKALGAELAKELDVKTDDKSKGKKEDDKGLAAAARMARTKDTPSGHGMDDVDWSSLNAGDFEAKKRQVFRLAKSGSFKA